ncbi:hypothetical protein BBK36DRAFT_1194429 [Trichoderma citrinoviride]|uniref:S1 motif domain-containing protein n=1 Tax=Trichoderma citrinoviride TaxID=58853 RepID=A0A2T4BFC4_9HYPO|nr:hypothetical protein BBK36DRAFT_1194429 [Trichoderma citrinoviride]PTB67968.1 hypothetical protein BBK36DRAFT_1194429 [Trichoderma citrinoviride]
MATDSIPSLAIPGTVLGPTSRYAPGPGTHIFGGNVVSSLLGNVSVTAPAKAPGPVKRLNKITAPTAEELSTISVVRRGRKREVLPDVGNIVLARVVRLMPKQAIVVIQQVGSTVLQTEWQGVIRVQDVRATEQDKVKIHESFKPGDIVRAQVISLGDQANYYLSTAANELGVIMATSDAGNDMVPISWKEFRDPETGVSEPRKSQKTAMSSTMVVTAASKTTSLFVDPSPSCCPSCGFVIPPPQNEPPSTQLLDAQARIAELESQVFQLNQKAQAAVDRWTEYEAELAKLRAKLASSPPSGSSTPEPAHSQSPSRSSFFQAGATRISALMYSRRSQPASPPPSASSKPMPKPPVTPPPPPAATATTMRTPGRTAEDLLEALNKEQTLRRAAEGRLNATNREVEELSVTLFEQANEMVATERRARAVLEQRISELEKRDAEKKRRLDKLELAMNRIEKVKVLLQEGYDAAALSLASEKI